MLRGPYSAKRNFTDARSECGSGILPEILAMPNLRQDAGGTFAEALGVGVYWLP